jgi:protein TonB
VSGGTRHAELPLPAQVIGPRERVRVTVLFSAILHAVVVLGISFGYEDPAASLPALDVILVQSSTEPKPRDPDFLANASQRGGGEHDEARRPREPLSSPVPKPTQGVAPQPIRASSPRPQPRRPDPMLATDRAALKVQRAQAQPEVPKLPEITGRELIERSLEMARLSAEIERQSEAYAKRPKRKFISANTQEYAYAAYMRAWVARVERIGNLNYPDEARDRRLVGQLVLTVAMRRDGSVERIDVIQPSGHRVLDEAAQRIVRLAEPFAPLPRTDDDVDILHITRTWQFLPGGTLGTR